MVLIASTWIPAALTCQPVLGDELWRWTRAIPLPMLTLHVFRRSDATSIVIGRAYSTPIGVLTY